MINIAIVDNEESILENVREIISDATDEYEDIHVDTYPSAAGLLEALRGVRYQILISDVDMPGMNGIELCKKVRRVYPGIYVVFLTAYVEYAVESYKMDAYQYILKSDMDSRLPEILDKLIHIVRRHPVKYCYVGTNTQRTRVCHDDIIWLKKGKGTKYTCFITAEEEHYERSSIEKALEKLDSKDFVIAERGRAVNLGHVMRIKDNIIYMSNGDEVEASFARIKKVKAAFNRYLEEA